MKIISDFLLFIYQGLIFYWSVEEFFWLARLPVTIVWPEIFFDDMSCNASDNELCTAGIVREFKILDEVA